MRARHRNRRARPLHGFTLIELLVVILIIALLISIVLPALTWGRYQAKVIRCGSTIRQLRIAYSTYSNDFDGSFPVTPNGSLEWDYSELHDVTASGFIEIRERLGGHTPSMFCPFYFDTYDKERFTGSEKGMSQLELIAANKFWYRNDECYTMGYSLMTHWRLDPELYDGYFADGEKLRVEREIDSSDMVLLADYHYLRGGSGPLEWEDGTRHMPPIGRNNLPGSNTAAPEGAWRALVDGSAHYAGWKQMKFRFGVPYVAENWW